MALFSLKFWEYILILVLGLIVENKANIFENYLFQKFWEKYQLLSINAHSNQTCLFLKISSITLYSVQLVMLYVTLTTLIISPEEIKITQYSIFPRM